MRSFGTVIGCVIGLWLIISLVSTFNTSGQSPATAMETSQLRAETAAAQAECKAAKEEVQRLKVELKKAQENNQNLNKRLAELQKTAGDRPVLQKSAPAPKPTPPMK